MKKLTLFSVAVMSANFLFAQNASDSRSSSNYIPCSSFYESIPVRDMPAQTDEERIAAAKHHEELEERREANRPIMYPDFKKRAEQADPVIQTVDGIKTLTAPLVNFDGGSDQGSCPNDPDGAVGPTQYVQGYNSSYQVFDKTGKALTAVIDLKTLFTNIPGDDGDPIVLYDKFAGRWFISEFQVDKAPCGFSIAISETGDATGKYYVYNFSNPLWTTQNYPDYPKFSIWSDGYYETSQYSPEGIVVFDRARMLAGKQSAGMILTPTPTPPAYFGGNNSLFSSAKTLDCDASALPPYGTPEFMTFFENTNSGWSSNMIVFFKLVHDTTTHTLTVSRWDSLAPATFNAYFTGGSEKDITQPGSASSLDALDGTFNFRVPFLEFTGYNSVLLCNTVNTGSQVAGVRWYEIRQNPTTFHFSIYQQGTYAPADGASRWNGSIGMDQDGDIALQYAVSSSSIYPSIRYTGRMATDAVNTMTGTEQTAIAGTSPAINCANRFGDYSEMTLDPSDGLTFWNTNEYDGAGNENNRIFSFRLSNVSPTGFANPIDLAQFKVYQDGNFINVIANTLPSNDDVQVDLFDAVGKQLSSKTVKPAGNSINEQISVNGIAMGVYFVRVGNLNYQRVFKVLVK
jgi:hypothetical protein